MESDEQVKITVFGSADNDQEFGCKPAFCDFDSLLFFPLGEVCLSSGEAVEGVSYITLKDNKRQAVKICNSEHNVD